MLYAGQRQHILKSRPQAKCVSLSGQHNEELLSKLANPSTLKDLHILGPDAESSIRIYRSLEAAARASYYSRSPRTDSILGLNQLCITRSLITNIEILGLRASEMHDDALSPLCMAGTWHASRSVPNLPSDLTPTAIQRSVPHHPWLDLLPIPQLRDNLILADAAGALDEYQLCHDMHGRNDSGTAFTGIIVWKDPWDKAGWEITTGFLMRWGWVLRDCWELLSATNYWRVKRGEMRISRITWAKACGEM